MLPHLAPATFPNPHLGKVFPLLINLWEPVLLYGARIGEKSQFCSWLSALNQRKPRFPFGNVDWFISFSHPEWFCWEFPGFSIQFNLSYCRAPHFLHLYLAFIRNLHLPPLFFVVFLLSTPSVWISGPVRISWVASPNGPIVFLRYWTDSTELLSNTEG